MISHYPVKKKNSLMENVINILPLMFDNMMRYKDHIIGHPRMKTQLHMMRITGKPMRYLMEIMEFTFGKEFSRNLREIKNIIELMGDIHDCDVFISELRSYLSELRAFNRTKQKLNEKFNLKSIIDLMNELKTKRNNDYKLLCEILINWEKENFKAKLIRSMQVEKLNAINYFKR